MVIDVGWRSTPYLADQFPALCFENQADKHKSHGVEHTDKTQHVYLIRNILWNCSDNEAINVLKTFMLPLEKSANTILLVNEMMSPATGTFPRYIEKGYRRRDVTVMTMHNAKQRTEKEWRALFAEASPNSTVCELALLEDWT